MRNGGPRCPRGIRQLLAPVLIVLVSLALGSVAAAQTARAVAPENAAASAVDGDADARLARRLQSRLQAVEGLDRVRGSVSSAVARLDGEVLDLPTRRLADTIAARTPGVDAVQNRIELSSELGARIDLAREQVTAKALRLLANTPLLVMAVGLVLLAWWIGGVVSDRLKLRRLHGRNPYLDGLVRRAVRVGLVLLGVLLALDLLGATPLVGAVLGSAGVIGLVAGLAFKDLAENYIAGILLSLRRPFEPGDHVLIEGREGKVVALTARATVLITLDGDHLLLPNSLVFKSVLLNFSRNPTRRFDFLTDVAAGASLREALDLGVATLARIDGVLADPVPAAQIHALHNDGASLRYLAWIDQRHNDLVKTRSEAMRLVRRALCMAGMSPPVPMQRVEVVRDGARAETTQADDGAALRDTSVDHDVDAQVDVARAQGGKDLLSSPNPREPGTG